MTKEIEEECQISKKNLNEKEKILSTLKNVKLIKLKVYLNNLI